MSRIQEQLTSRENLSWAWQKARRLYESADGPVDLADVAAFELDLERQLGSIAAGFSDLSYRLRPLALLPQPKKPDENGNPRLRQSFHVSVRDQVAWIALINVVGPILDSKMPAWIYGHRLYKAAWFEEQDDGQSRLELGPYRHSSGALYRKFKHSWPLFRRHISLSARLMVQALDDEDQLDASEKSALNYGDRPAYLKRGYWQTVESPTLYYASIDLEQFYPKISKSAIRKGFRKYLPDFREDQWLRDLIDRMLDFRVGRAGSRLLGDLIVQPKTDVGPFGGIPTGLMVAGFLSNVAMLPLDRLTDLRLRKNRRIAHFRFVDDHAVLAYDFDELRAWIRKYERALGRLGVGPIISPTKFDPPEMAAALPLDADAAIVTKARLGSKMDGSHPSKLMTKTLALVSELAGADFDILSEDSRGQRLRELEWLLLADLPDREIRSDTRAAFAAGRIASLVPVAFSPSVELLRAWRDFARLDRLVSQESEQEQREELEAARKLVILHQTIERDRYFKRVDHYFKLILQAFYDHPDKPRLFIRVLDYCRVTGHGGTGDVLRWIAAHTNDDQRPLATYLRPLAVQTIARHITTAAFDLTDMRLLERQRFAAGRYLVSISGQKTRALLKAMVRAGDDADVATASARACFYAASAWAADAVGRRTRRRALHARVKALAAEVGAPTLTAASSRWVQSAGSPIGVWTHWLDGVLRHRGNDPGPVWMITASKHDPKVRLDWQSLRKGPHALPKNQADFLATEGVLKLSKSDAGWLLDQGKSRYPIDLDALQPGPLVVRRLRRHLKDTLDRKDYISAPEWVLSLSTALVHDDHDPRASEWTALEILRQILARIKEFPGLEVEVLDELHPSNVLLPRAWLAKAPPGDSLHSRWTWESWKHVVRNDEKPITLARHPVEDFRRQPPVAIDDADGQSQWRARLRGCGLLLLGLVARDFGLPASWNIRGLERDAAGFVRATLEEVPLSSHTHAIIEAALLPRSAETALMRTAPWAFFGAKTVSTINDTTTDPPIIRDVDALWSSIAAAQKTLEERQISVLDHAPRQLIPMNVIQLIGTAVDVPEQDLEA